MKEALLMDVGKSLGHLPSDVSYFMVFQVSAFLASLSDELIQVFLDVFEDKMGVIAYSNHFL